MTLTHWPTPSEEPHAYEGALRSEWGYGDDVAIVEGDKVPTVGMIRHMIGCPRELCAQAYRIYPVTTGMLRTEYAHRVRAEDGSIRWLAEGDTEAVSVGFGIVRFRASVTARTPEWEPGIWNGLDTRVSDWLRRLGYRWHVHWPEAAHLHAGRE